MTTKRFALCFVCLLALTAVGSAAKKKPPPWEKPLRMGRISTSKIALSVTK